MSLCFVYLVHGNWSPWGQWSSCSMTCGYGTRTRERSCTTPAPEHGGRDCLGDNTETGVCDFNPYCDGKEKMFLYILRESKKEMFALDSGPLSLFLWLILELFFELFDFEEKSLSL